MSEENTNDATMYDSDDDGETDLGKVGFTSGDVDYANLEKSYKNKAAVSRTVRNRILACKNIIVDTEENDNTNNTDSEENVNAEMGIEQRKQLTSVEISKKQKEKTKINQEKKAAAVLSPFAAALIGTYVTLQAEDRMSWAIRVHLSGKHILDEVMGYFSEDNKALSLLTGSLSIVNEINSLKKNFNVDTAMKISKMSSYGKEIVDLIISQWKECDSFSISSDERRTIIDVIKILLKRHSEKEEKAKVKATENDEEDEEEDDTELSFYELFHHKDYIRSIDKSGLYSLGRERIQKICNFTVFSKALVIGKYEEEDEDGNAIVNSSMTDENTYIDIRDKNQATKLLLLNELISRAKREDPYDSKSVTDLFEKYGQTVTEDEYKESVHMYKHLDCDDLIEQIKQMIVKDVQPTELQKHLFDAMNSTNSMAQVIIGPPGCGKTTGLMTKDKNGILVCYPINDKAYVEMIANFWYSGKPFVMAHRDESGEKIVYESSFETVGKLLSYDTSTGETFKEKYPLSIVELYRRLEQLEQLTPQQIARRNNVLKKEEKEKEKNRNDTQKTIAAARKRVKSLRKKRFITKKIEIVVCHPNLRKSGGMKVYEDTCSFARQTGRSFTDENGVFHDAVTAIIDDFGANDLEMMKEKEIIKMSVLCNRIIMISGTAPTGMQYGSIINFCREQKNKQKFQTFQFSKTLGLGLNLRYFDNDRNEKEYSLLLGPRKIFDQMASAFQCISQDTVFELLNVKYKQKLRNFMLSNLYTITLDSLRQNIFDWLYSLPDEERINIVQKVLEKVELQNKIKYNTKHQSKLQTLYLSDDPLAYAKQKFPQVILRYEIKQEEQHESSSGKKKQKESEFISFLDELKRRITNFEREKKAQEKQYEKEDKPGASRTDGETRKTAGRSRQDVVFNNANIHADFDLKFVETQLALKDEIGEEKLCYLLQRSVLIVDGTSPAKWVESIIKKGVKHIFGTPVSMGIGVDIPFLEKVYLDPKASFAVTLQNVGRVGRPSQDTPGVVVFDNLYQLTNLYSVDIGTILDRIFESTAEKILVKTLQQYKRNTLMSTVLTQVHAGKANFNRNKAILEQVRTQQERITPGWKQEVIILKVIKQRKQTVLNDLNQYFLALHE